MEKDLHIKNVLLRNPYVHPSKVKSLLDMRNKIIPSNYLHEGIIPIFFIPDRVVFNFLRRVPPPGQCRAAQPVKGTHFDCV